jgi:predicted TIM-barrel fold metal-dependent hydrolase
VPESVGKVVRTDDAERAGTPQGLDAARAAAFSTPPPRRVSTPVLDIHAHTGRRQIEELVRAARIYGVKKILGIGSLDDGLRARDRYPDEILIATTLLWDHRSDPALFARENLELLARAVAHDVRVVKLWFGPRIYPRYEGLHLDAPLLDPVFDAIAGYRLNALVHIADPDLWFVKKYADVATYGTKADQYPQLEARLAQYPALRFLAAHMGGHPEDLDHLAGLLDRYPNLSLDTSATRWIVRELGRQPEAVRAFFSTYAGRLLFGTDQVVLDDSEPERYTVRYWVHQMFWETDLVCELPIDDPDAEGGPMLRGVNLPSEVLSKIYWENAVRWLGPAPEA